MGSERSSKRLLLLYDTTDKDLARDLADLLAALDVSVDMIPRAADGGSTLQQKEADFFANVDAALFLITPGSERHGKHYPSPSVADEMGQAKERFRAEPWRVVYLVDSKCSIQATDQKAYVQFVREDCRSVIEALRLVILGLKDAGILAVQLPAAPSKPAEINIGDIVKALTREQALLLMGLSRHQNGNMFHFDYVKAAGAIAGNATDGNLLVRDLYGKGLASFTEGAGGSSTSWVTGVGWEVVRVLRALERSQQARPTLGGGTSPASTAR